MKKKETYNHHLMKRMSKSDRMRRSGVYDDVVWFEKSGGGFSCWPWARLCICLCLCLGVDGGDGGGDEEKNPMRRPMKRKSRMRRRRMPPLIRRRFGKVTSRRFVKYEMRFRFVYWTEWSELYDVVSRVMFCLFGLSFPFIFFYFLILLWVSILFFYFSIISFEKDTFFS